LKSKGKTYLLLVAVLGIWGTIAYKIVNGLNPDEPQVSEKNFDIVFNPKQQKAVAPFLISDIERDPFLGTLTSKKTASKATKRVSVVKTDIAMPSITYGGLIQRQDSNSKVFVVNINNQQHLLKLGQTINDVKLISGNKSSITIRFNGKNHIVKL
tara:strand:- start:789 stop:1253 length:465 start_codon:yes stop_codon:yes gene_type:complete